MSSQSTISTHALTVASGLIVAMAQSVGCFAAETVLRPADVTAATTQADGGLDPQTQFEAALKYLNDEGVPTNADRGLTLLRRAAERGLPQAQSNLGVIYSEGSLVPRDDVLAVSWFRKAALVGWAPAQVNLGLAYAQGLGVGEDTAEAVRWFSLAARQANAMAEFNLGVAYLKGAGVSMSQAEAIHWFSLSAQHGYVPAIQLLRPSNDSVHSAN